MGLRLEERLEAIEDAVARLVELDTNTLIVVEGRRDIEALRLLGVEAEVRALNERGTVLDFADALVGKYPQVVILTDWDRKGGQLARMLIENLQARVTLETDIRRRLAKYSSVRTVEDLPTYIGTLRRKLAGGIAERRRREGAP